jgi:hypothetical protein
VATNSTPGSRIDTRVGARVFDAVLASHLDIADVARMVGLSGNDMFAMCMGIRRFPVAKLTMIADLVDQRIAWFFADFDA